MRKKKKKVNKQLKAFDRIWPQVKKNAVDMIFGKKKGDRCLRKNGEP